MRFKLNSYINNLFKLRESRQVTNDFTKSGFNIQHWYQRYKRKKDLSKKLKNVFSDFSEKKFLDKHLENINDLSTYKKYSLKTEILKMFSWNLYSNFLKVKIF